MLQILAALQQAVQFTHLQRQRLVGCGLLCSPKAGQHQRILAVCLGAVARALRPLPHLPRIGQANRPVLVMGKGDQRQFIAARRFDNPLRLRGAGGHLGGLDRTYQGLKPGRVIAEFAQHYALRLPHGRRGEARFRHVNANP